MSYDRFSNVSSSASKWWSGRRLEFQSVLFRTNTNSLHFLYPVVCLTLKKLESLSQKRKDRSKEERSQQRSWATLPPPSFLHDHFLCAPLLLYSLSLWWIHVVFSLHYKWSWIEPLFSGLMMRASGQSLCTDLSVNWWWDTFYLSWDRALLQGSGGPWIPAGSHHRGTWIRSGVSSDLQSDFRRIRSSF